MVSASGTLHKWGLLERGSRFPIKFDVHCLFPIDSVCLVSLLYNLLTCEGVTVSHISTRQLIPRHLFSSLRILLLSSLLPLRSLFQIAPLVSIAGTDGSVHSRDLLGASPLPPVPFLCLCHLTHKRVKPFSRYKGKRKIALMVLSWFMDCITRGSRLL